jgi:hypothetical protein
LLKRGEPGSPDIAKEEDETVLEDDVEILPDRGHRADVEKTR